MRYDYDRWRGDALLPTGERMNPRQPEKATYFDKDQVAFIIDIKDPYDTGPSKYRVLTSFGGLDDYALGTVHFIRHDQTGKILAHNATVVGIANFRKIGTPEAWEGHIPDKALPHWVFK